MFENMKSMLDRAYGIQVVSLQEMPSGWSASAWKAHSNCGDYFVKVYDKHKPSTKSWVARIDSYMPVVLWLYDHTRLKNRMNAPLFTKEGSYKWEDAAFIYMVFPYIDGWTICDSKLNPDQVRELAQIIAELHAYGAEIPVSTAGLMETFDISFCLLLIDRLMNPQNSAVLKEALPSDIGIIFRAIATLQKTAVSLPKSELRYSICHTDIHGRNLMQSENLILIDWEGLKLAPVEADLFSFTKTFFFGYAWEDFISVYCAMHKDYRVNDDVIRYYRFRRRLEDIHVFVESILYDCLTQDDMNRSLRYLKQECDVLATMH